MNEAVIKEKLAELCDAIARLPSSGSEPSPDKDQGAYLSEAHVNPKSIDEALNSLRLQIKYVVFDLEATRRENRYLRQMLESRPKRPGDKGE